MADALGPAIEKTDRAAMQGIRCPGVETDTVKIARRLQADLERFLMTEDPSYPIQPGAQKAATAVLDCAITMDQVEGKKTSGLATLAIGAVVIGGLILIGTQVLK